MNVINIQKIVQETI